jgi:hypothetical protein
MTSKIKDMKTENKKIELSSRRDKPEDTVSEAEQ